MPNKFKHICYLYIYKVNLREEKCTALFLFSKLFILKQILLLTAFCVHVGKQEFRTFKKPSTSQNNALKMKYLFTLFTLLFNILKIQYPSTRCSYNYNQYRLEHYKNILHYHSNYHQFLSFPVQYIHFKWLIEAILHYERVLSSLFLSIISGVSTFI